MVKECQQEKITEKFKNKLERRGDMSEDFRNEKLRKELEEQGRKQKWLCEKVGITDFQLTQHLNHGLPLTSDKKFAIAEVLGKTIKELFDK